LDLSKNTLKTLAFLILLMIVSLIVSCRSIEEINLQNRLLDTKTIIVSVNNKTGYETLKWDCYSKPYKNQPCYGFSDHPIFLFDNTVIGDTLKLIIK